MAPDPAPAAAAAVAAATPCVRGTPADARFGRNVCVAFLGDHKCVASENVSSGATKSRAVSSYRLPLPLSTPKRLGGPPRSGGRGGDGGGGFGPSGCVARALRSSTFGGPVSVCRGGPAPCVAGECVAVSRLRRRLDRSRRTGPCYT